MSDLRNFKFIIFIYTLIRFLLMPSILTGQEADRVIILSKSIGEEIDSLENVKFRIFPDYERVQKGKIFKNTLDIVYCKVWYWKDSTLKVITKVIPDEKADSLFNEFSPLYRSNKFVITAPDYEKDKQPTVKEQEKAAGKGILPDYSKFFKRSDHLFIQSAIGFGLTDLDLSDMSKSTSQFSNSPWLSSQSNYPLICPFYGLLGLRMNNFAIDLETSYSLFNTEQLLDAGIAFNYLIMPDNYIVPAFKLGLNYLYLSSSWGVSSTIHEDEYSYTTLDRIDYDIKGIAWLAGFGIDFFPSSSASLNLSLNYHYAPNLLFKYDMTDKVYKISTSYFQFLLNFKVLFSMEEF